MPRIGHINRKTLPFSDETKEVIKSLDKECELLNDNMIDTTHILLAVLAKNLPTTEILSEAYNINYNSFKKMMKEMKDGFTQNAYEGDDMDDNESFSKKRNKQNETKSKTPVLDNFCRDISKAVEKGEIDPVVGRANEIKRVSQILSRRKKNNPVLIGEPGVGKTSIVEGLAQLIKEGNAPRTLANKKLYSLDLASIVAGTKYRGQFEERMKAVLEECKANPDVVLFIDELHTIVGAGNASGSLDASNIFKPALARGEIQIIGATTLDEYRENIEKDGALTRRFQQVLVEEPTLEETKIDWRKRKIPFQPYLLPNEISEKCLALTKKLNLSFGAIDIIRNKSGEYIFLEINPNGQWAWLETEAGLKISDEIINFLANPDH
jgi:ATP-dependent Clp protease ATP-binding subunit ClpC